MSIVLSSAARPSQISSLLQTASTALPSQGVSPSSTNSVAWIVGGAVIGIAFCTAVACSVALLLYLRRKRRRLAFRRIISEDSLQYVPPPPRYDMVEATSEQPYDVAETTFSESVYSQPSFATRPARPRLSIVTSAMPVPPSQFRTPSATPAPAVNPAGSNGTFGPKSVAMKREDAEETPISTDSPRRGRSLARSDVAS